MIRWLVLLCAVTAFSASPAGYRVLGKIPIGGEGGWDYLTVDSAAHRLYVSHATRVVVVDLNTGKIAGEIPDTPGVHGVAIVAKLGRGFTSNGRSNNVTIFDLKTMKSLGQVQTGQNPDAILYDEVSGYLFTFNGRSHDSTVINAGSGKVAGTIPLGGKPEFSVTDGKGRIYVNIEDTSEIVVIDSRKLTVIKRYALTGCEEPSGLALDVAHRRLFSVCANRVMAVSSPDTGKVVATVPIGQAPDGAGFDPETGFAFSSNGDGTLTIVHEVSSKYKVVANLATQRSARTMTIDPATHKLYLPAATPDGFAVLIVGN